MSWRKGYSQLLRLSGDMTGSGGTKMVSVWHEWGVCVSSSVSVMGVTKRVVKEL